MYFRLGSGFKTRGFVSLAAQVSSINLKRSRCSLISSGKIACTVSSCLSSGAKRRTSSVAYVEFIDGPEISQ